MRRIVALLLVLACVGFAAAACGTSNGPGGGGGNVEGAGTQGQEVGQQPAAGGMKNGAYTAANNECSLYPLAQLAQQNGLPSNATKKQVATKVSEGESSKADKKSAYAGCLKALNTP